MDTKLKCHICGKEDEDSIQNMLRNGWKFHCGEAMHIEETDAAAVNKAVLEQRMKYNKKNNRWEQSSLAV